MVTPALDWHKMQWNGSRRFTNNVYDPLSVEDTFIGFEYSHQDYTIIAWIN